MVEFSGRFIRTSEIFDLAAAREHPPCNCSSGSDQSPDLLDLVESFIDREVEDLHEDEVNDEEEEDYDDRSDEDYEDVKERLREILENHGGEERRRIRDEVVNASLFVVGEKRDLMTYLRNKGFDAGLCKSRWDKFGKNTAGKYEYVDIKGENNNRYIIETNLVGEFEIARPTTRYLSLLSQLPHIFVGTPEELKHIVRIMCFEIRKSMKKAKIYLPPWRRNGYMQAKWFGHYKRTCNEVVTRVKNCGCGERVRFEEPVKVMSFNEGESRKISDLKIGRLTLTFNAGSEVAV